MEYKMNIRELMIILSNYSPDTEVWIESSHGEYCANPIRTYSKRIEHVKHTLILSNSFEEEKE